MILTMVPFIDLLDHDISAEKHFISQTVILSPGQTDHLDKSSGAVYIYMIFISFFYHAHHFSRPGKIDLCHDRIGCLLIKKSKDVPGVGKEEM